jgi:hypothetical protein
MTNKFARPCKRGKMWGSNALPRMTRSEWGDQRPTGVDFKQLPPLKREIVWSQN